MESEETGTERLTVRFPVNDLNALFGPFYRNKHASDFVADFCRVCLHSLVIQGAYQQVELHRLNTMLSRQGISTELLAKRLADELAKRPSTKDSPP